MIDVDIPTPTSTTIVVTGSTTLNSLAANETHVTKITFGDIEQYFITAPLKISGSSAILEDDLSQKIVIIHNESRHGLIEAHNGGIIRFQGTNTRGSYTTNKDQNTLFFALTTGSTWDRGEIALIGSGEITFKNLLLKGAISPMLGPNANGSVLWEDVVIDKEGASGDIQTNIYGHKENVTFRRVKHYVYGQTGITFRDRTDSTSNGTTPVIIDNEVFQARDAWNNESQDIIVVEGLPEDRGNTVDVAQWDSQRTRIIGSQLGTQFLWGGHSDSPAFYSYNRGVVEVFANVSVNVVSGDNISSVKLYIEDNPAVASTQTIAFDNTAATVKRTYTATAAVDGTFAAQTILIGEGQRTSGGAQIVGGDDNRIRPRGKNVLSTHTASTDVDDDIYDYSLISYYHETVFKEIVLKSTSTVEIEERVFSDPKITESEEAVAALTTIDNLEQLVDREKYIYVQSYGSSDYPVGSESFFSVSEATVTIKSGYGLIRDQSISEPLVIDGANIKIKTGAGGLLATDKYDTLAGAVDDSLIGHADVKFVKSNGKVVYTITNINPNGFDYDEQERLHVLYKKTSESSWSRVSSANGAETTFNIDVEPSTDYNIRIRAMHYTWIEKIVTIPAFGLIESASLAPEMREGMLLSDFPFSADEMDNISYENSTFTVEAENLSDDMLTISFGSAYRKLSEILHNPNLVEYWANNIEVNSSGTGFIIPRNNFTNIHMSTASLGHVIFDFTIKHDVVVFSTTESYVQNNVVVYNDEFYTFKESKSAGAWDASKVRRITEDAIDRLHPNSAGKTIQIKSSNVNVTAKVEVDELHTALDNYSNKDDYKADINGVTLTADEQNLISKKVRDYILSTTSQSSTPVGGVREHTP